MPRSLFITCILLIACDSDKGVTAFIKPEASITSHSDDDRIERISCDFAWFCFDANHRYDELFATWYAGSKEICALKPSLNRMDCTV